MRSKGKKAGSSLVLWIIGIYLLFPLFLTFLYSLFTEWMTILPKGFSLNAYVELFQDVYFWQSILRSLIISIVPIAVCTIVVLLAMYVIIVYLPGLDKIMKIVCTIPYAVQGVILPISVLGLYANAPAPFSNRVFMLACTYCIVVLPYIYQGVRNVDETLIKAARVLGAKDRDIFVKVIFPATTPFIITAVRLGVSVALTTLIAAESTGAVAGLGMRIRSLNNSFDVPPMLLYIIIIGIIGITSEKIIKYLERKFTGWQETREI